jgi:hypothetical protein
VSGKKPTNLEYSKKEESYSDKDEYMLETFSPFRDDILASRKIIRKE